MRPSEAWPIVSQVARADALHASAAPDARYSTSDRLAADSLPRSRAISYLTFCPSLSELRPARYTALMWTNTSLPPSLGWMNPKPFWVLNHLTVPVAILASLILILILILINESA